MAFALIKYKQLNNSLFKIYLAQGLSDLPGHCFESSGQDLEQAAEAFLSHTALKVRLLSRRSSGRRFRERYLSLFEEDMIYLQQWLTACRSHTQTGGGSAPWPGPHI